MNKLDNKVILVTGASGFIGLHMVDRLSRIAGVKLLLLSRQYRQATQQDVVWLTGELEELTAKYWQSHAISHIDYVFHLGAFTPKNAMEVDLVEDVYRGNLLGTRALLESLPNIPRQIIFSSALDVYAPSVEENILTEMSRVDPPSLYGASKFFCEHLIKVYSKKYACPCAILRYGHIYGPGERAYEKLIPQVIKSLLKNESPVLYGDGGAYRDYMFVTDVVEATIRAALYGVESLAPINIVSGRSRTTRQLVELLSNMVGFKGEIKYLPEKKNDRSLRFDNRRMIEVLGQWDMVGLENGLKQEIEYFNSL